MTTCQHRSVDYWAGDTLGDDMSTCSGIENSTYTLMTLTKEEILDNHRSVLCSFRISTKEE